jgi:hypothetical protein
MQFFAV